MAFEVACRELVLISTPRLMIVEGGFPMFGVGSEICAQIVESEAFDYLDAPVERVTGAGMSLLHNVIMWRFTTHWNLVTCRRSNTLRCQLGSSCLPRYPTYRQGGQALSLPHQLKLPICGVIFLLHLPLCLLIGARTAFNRSTILFTTDNEWTTFYPDFTTRFSLAQAYE